ncbi:MAG: zf-HC2 domain-containing protein [Candidatus Omnitrophota bacterium]
MTMVERSCPYNHERLTSYASGNLSHAERSDVEHHLAICAECRQELNEFQKTWLALDLWQEESAPAAPCLQDLRFRIAAAKQSQSSWNKVRNSLRLPQGLFRLAPAMTLAGVMGAVFLYPWVQQTQMAVVQNDVPESRYSSELINMAAEALTRADIKQNDRQIAQNNENALSETDLEDQFNDALNSRQYQQERNRMLTSARPIGRLDTLSFTNVGYRPTAAIIPAHENSDAVRPTALYQTNNDQSIRLGD